MGNRRFLGYGSLNSVEDSSGQVLLTVEKIRWPNFVFSVEPSHLRHFSDVEMS